MAGHLFDTTWQQTKHLHQVVWWTFAWIYWGRFQVSNQIFLIVMVIPSTRKENYCLWEPHDLNLLPASHPHFIHYDVQFRHFMVRKEEGETWNSRAFCVAGVALGDIDRHFAWQAYGTGLALTARWPRLAPWSPRLFAWQAWRLATSTIVSDGLEAVGILSSSVRCIIILDIYFTHTHVYIQKHQWLGSCDWRHAKKLTCVHLRQCLIRTPRWYNVQPRHLSPPGGANHGRQSAAMNLCGMISERPAQTPWLSSIFGSHAEYWAGLLSCKTVKR